MHPSAKIEEDITPSEGSTTAGRMAFHFCPQCGTKLQPEFNFCPSCGEKLPCADDEPEPFGGVVASSSFSLLSSNDTAASFLTRRPVPSTTLRHMKASPRPSLQKTRKSIRLDREANYIPDTVPSAASVAHSPGDDETEDTGQTISPAKPRSVTIIHKPEMDHSSLSPDRKSPQSVRGKSRYSTQEGKRLFDKMTTRAEALVVEGISESVSPPDSSSISKTVLKETGKSKAKKAKRTPTLEPLQEGEEVTDTTGKKWKLIKLLSQSCTELIYEVSLPNAKVSNHFLKLGANVGSLFNEQNFLQRAAKPASVEKWIKQNKMDFLGIPSCVGFGRHAESYRFLVFPSIGQSLQSFIEEENRPLSEKVVLQLACRIVDVLEYLHSNEYVHADINAENIYIKPGQKSQVYLVSYCNAFRYCPGGKHVEYREGSRKPHEGAIEFISLDIHKGAAPSRRSDLQSLGYCMLHWHTRMLPWTELTQPEQVANEKQRYMDDVAALLHHCFGKNKVSPSFQTYLKSVMALQYSEQPDYSVLKSGLSSALLLLGGSLEQQLSF